MCNSIKKWMIGISALGLVFISVFSIWFVDQKQIKCEIITEKQLNQIQTKLIENKELNLKLIFDNEELPCNRETQTFYLPMEMEGEWTKGTLEAKCDDTGAELFLLEDFREYDKKEVIASNSDIPFVAVSNDQYLMGNIKITGVPIASFSSTEETSAEGLPIFKLDVFDYASNGDWTWHVYTTSSLHGNTSLAYDKKSLRLKLLQRKEDGFEKCNKNLLGLREDDDWILNGLYGDESRVRDKLCIDLWNELGAKSNPYGKSYGTDGEFVEVFINEAYQGLYLLQYPIDRKQLGMEAVSKQLARGEEAIERIYKKKYTSFWKEEDYLGELPDPNMPDFRGGFYLKGDTVLGNLEEWEPLRRLAACMESDSEEYRSSITEIVDKQNVIENWLFYQAIAGFDNQAKNTYYAVRKKNDNLKGYFIPWDLNISFGVVYADNAYYCEADESTVEQIVEWEPGQRMITENVSDSATLAQETWADWRAGALSEKSLNERISRLERFVKDSGAFWREKERWKESNCNDDFSLLYRYAKNRMEFVDRYVAGLK